MTIIEFIKARLEEDERFAKAVAEEEDARQRAGRSQAWPLYNRGEPALGMHWNHEDEISVDHRRVLAEVVAKRAILDAHPVDEVVSLDPETRYQTFLVCKRCRENERQVVAPCPTLRALAYSYRHREGWQQGWAP